MALLHATWLPPSPTKTNSGRPGVFVWADEWRASRPLSPNLIAATNPFALCTKDLKEWLTQKDLLPSESLPAIASLTLPSKKIKQKTSRKSSQNKEINEEITKFQWSGLPLQSGEPIPTECEWWPWIVEGIEIKPDIALEWLYNFPLSAPNPEISDEILWWNHLHRWSLSLIARERWLPQIELSKEKGYPHKAKWMPLINMEDDRQKLEDLATNLPLVCTCAMRYKAPIDTKDSKTSKPTTRIAVSSMPIACIKPKSNLLTVANLIEIFLDIQLRTEFNGRSKGLDPILEAWESALTSETGIIELSEEGINRLSNASKSWKESISGNVQPARTALILKAPTKKEDLWSLNFSLQAQADPTLSVSASTIWMSRNNIIHIGDIRIDNASEIFLEGLGRALTVFEPLKRGLNEATPSSMELTPIEAFLLVRTAAKKLRDRGIGVELPSSISGGLASRLGLAIFADLEETSKGEILREKLNWKWNLVIGGVAITLKELQRIGSKQTPLICHKGVWIELRPNDIKNAEKFCNSKPSLNLDDALRITATDNELYMKLPVHSFDAGPKLASVLKGYHQQSPDPLPAPKGFNGQLRPYQERGLGWLSFLHRFNQGACLADDMGLGKTIQILAFIQKLKIEGKLHLPILLIAPTSVITNWKREASSFTPNLKVFEHYGPSRASNPKTLQTKVHNINIVLTTYGLMQRDINLLMAIEWQGIIIDEAQAIKNPNTKQSQAIRTLAKSNQNKLFRFALTGTPVENRISEIWALMDFLNPKVLGEETFFHQRYRIPIENYGDISSQKDLKSRINPFILRRVKTDKSIIADLPEKIELREWVSLSSEQKILYKKTVEETLGEMTRMPTQKHQGKVLGLLTKLKQICNHPALALHETSIDDNFLQRSGKLERLENIIQEVIEAGDRAILFTQFAEWGHLLKEYFESKWKFEVPFLYGGSTKNDRQNMIDRFQEDPRGPQIFLLSLKAGGIGLNLTRANHVFHIDRWWNPAVENQATDRAYRIGQKSRVMVHKFITSGSVEEKIDKMISEKSNLAENIIGSGEDWLGKLDINKVKKLVELND